MLTKRLGAAAALIGSCATLYDVGCDHGYLPLALLQAGQIQNACFCDISAPSLEKARAHTAQAGWTARARFVLADGLTGLTPCARDAVSICGMGGLGALHIVSNAGVLPCPVIIQANSEREALRRGLAALGYRASQEQILFENGRYYILARYEAGTEPLSDLQAAFGPRLLEKRPTLFEAYLNRQQAILQKALRGAQNDAQDGARVARALKLTKEAMG